MLRPVFGRGLQRFRRFRRDASRSGPDRRGAAPRSGQAAGFTLVECAVALAIIGLAIGTLLPATMEALGRQSGAAEERAALAEAETLLG